MISIDGKIKLTLVRNAEWNEWMVKHYDMVDNKWVYSEDKTYFTSDKQDAIDTMKFSMKRYETWPKIRIKIT